MELLRKDAFERLAIFGQVLSERNRPTLEDRLLETTTDRAAEALGAKAGGAA